MELPQPRPFGTEGGKATHDFLSLYSTVQQDPTPPQGSNLKTHDFLQPLERGGKSRVDEDNNMEKTAVETPPPQASLVSVGQLAHGGIGTYICTSHFPCFSQRVPKPEGVATPGETGKGNTGRDRHAGRDVGIKVGGQWSILELPSPSTSNNHLDNTFGLRSSSHSSSGQRNKSFLDIIKSAKCTKEEEDGSDKEFILKKEPSSLYEVKVDGRCTDPKANSPRSKHSATEQRRRSKINDRFQTLRELIPHSEQKRDKASFLLEVIEYIRCLQEKVHKYEKSYKGWNHDPANLMPCSSSDGPEELVDHSRSFSSGSGQALTFAAKLEENNFSPPSSTAGNSRNPVELDIRSARSPKAMGQSPKVRNNAVPAHTPLQTNVFIPGESGSEVAQPALQLACDAENISSQHRNQLWQSKSCSTDRNIANDNLKEQKLTIENGTICISSVYSQGLLNKLKQALHNSGVDVSQASISAQFDIGKQENTSLTASTSILEHPNIASNNQATVRHRVARSGEESDQALKRLKTIQ